MNFFQRVIYTAAHQTRQIARRPVPIGYLLLFFCLVFSNIGLSVSLESNSTNQEITNADGRNVSISGEPNMEVDISAGLAVYRQVLRAKRMEQRKSILMLHDIQDHKKQAKLSKPAIEKILEILAHHRSHGRPNITSFETLSLSEKEELSALLENILFLGDFVLRLPDTSSRLLKKTPGALETVHWAVAFASSLDFLETADLRVLDLMAQELNLIPRSEGYVNVYTEAYKRLQAEEQKRAAKEAAKSKKSSDKKKKPKPLMSGQFIDEL